MSVRWVLAPPFRKRGSSRANEHRLHCVIFAVNAKLSFRAECGTEWRRSEALDQRAKYILNDFGYHDWRLRRGLIVRLGSAPHAWLENRLPHWFLGPDADWLRPPSDPSL